jgi:hypothetical protein
LPNTTGAGVLCSCASDDVMKIENWSPMRPGELPSIATQ